jgi:hypothetical protein
MFTLWLLLTRCSLWFMHTGAIVNTRAALAADLLVVADPADPL